MRVVMLDPNSHTLPYDRALTRALVAAGCEVELAASPFLYAPAATAGDLPVARRFFVLAAGEPARRLGLERRPGTRRAAKALEYPLDWLALLARLAWRRPDVVHVQWSLRPDLERRIWRWLQRRGVPVVYTAHDLLPHGATPSDRGRYRRLYAAADAIIVHTERAAADLTGAFGVPAGRVWVAPHGPLLTEEPALTRDAARRRLGLPRANPIVLFAGLIEPYKGLDDLVTAFIDLARADAGVRLVVAGRPNMPITAEQARIAAAGLDGRVAFDPRFLPQPDLAAYLCAADVVALPYRVATASGLLMAARRFGRPVVATAVGDLGVVVEHEVTGLLIPPSDPAALTAALHRLLADPALAARLGAAGQRAALERDTWPAAAARTLAAYRAVARMRDA